MTRRWERELRSLRDVDAPVERIRSRSAIGPNRRAPDPLPPRARIAAGLVACSVFVAAGAFAWRAFDGSGNEHTGSAPGMSTYTDALGWQIDYPADWRVVPIQYDEPRVQEFGAQFSNVPLALPSSSPGAPVQPNADLAPDGVALTVTHLNGGPRRDPAGLPEPPLSPDHLTVGSAAGGSPSLDTLSFRIGDVPFDLAVKMGPEVSSDQIAVVEEMIRSIRPTAADEVPSPSATPMIAWWNASPDDWEVLSSFSTATPSPVAAGPLLRLGEDGRGACSFSILFAVPDVPPGAYPIVIIAEANGSSTMEATFTFTVR